MKNTLKTGLTRSHKTKDPTFNDAHVIIAGNRQTADIIDEIINEGLTVDREIILDVIARFNRKAAELVLSGYNVNTGLVTMNSEIKGQVHNEKWNPYTNKIGVSFKPGIDLLQEINNTKVEIMKDEVLNNEITDINQMNQSANNTSVSNQATRVNDRYLHIDNDVPACGIAFRRWLCKA